MTTASFFLKIGCSDQKTEYSLFVETGCKSDDARNDDVRIVKRQAPRIQPASPQIKGVALNSDIPITTREVRSPIEDVSDEEQNEFRITIAQFAVERLRECNEAGEAEENYLVQDVSSNDEFEETESSEFEAAISNFSSDEVHAELAEIVLDEFEPFDEAPNTEGEFAEAEFDLLMGETGEIVQAEEVDETGSSIDFGEASIADRIETYSEVQVLEAEIAAVLFEVEEFEVCLVEEAPNTEVEFAAAKLGPERTEIVSIEESSVEEIPAAIADHSMTETDWMISDFGLELKAPEQKEAAQFEDGQGSVTPVDLGEIVLTESIEPYLELPTSNARYEIASIVRVEEIECIGSELEICAFGEAPNTEKEFSGAESDVKRIESEVIHHAPYEDPIEAETSNDRPSKRFQVEAHQIEPYAEPVHLQRREEFVQMIPHAEVEPENCEEAPNIAEEFTPTEDTDLVHAAAFEDPVGNEIPTDFGDVAIEDNVEPYAELAHLQRRAELVQMIPHVEVESEDYEEAPNVAEEFSAPVAEREVEVAAVEAPKEADVQIVYEELASEEKGDSFTELYYAEQKNNEPAAEITAPDSEVIEKAQEPAIEPAQVAAVETDPVEKEVEMPAWFKSWIASPESAPKAESSSSKEYSRVPWPKFFSIRHTWGKQEKDCIPFASNYTTAELVLAPDYKLGSVLPLLDLRGHRFDNNTYAANAGVGGRYIPDPGLDKFCEILGFNAYYDFRQGCIGYYQQVGLGLEVLGRRWDLRANAYAPFGKRRHISRCVFDDYDGDYYAIRDSIESISYSFNAELGFLLLDKNNFTLYAAGGPYFLARAKCNDGVPGGEIRLRPQYKDYIALDLSWRYDELFETIWQLGIILNLPLYQISNSNKYPCGMSDRQIYQPIERFEVMPLSKRTCWFTNWE